MATADVDEAITYEYDDSGIRVAKTELNDVNNDGDFDDVGTDTSTRTDYHVDHHNPTAYAQTVEEDTVDPSSGNTVSKKVYVVGHDEITQTTYEYDTSGNITGETTHTFLHDGHGSVRALADTAVLEAYSYAAYGDLLAIHNAQAALAGTDAEDALTNLLYSGEHFDAKIGQQYLRARWYNPATGTFNRLDPFAGNITDPQSLHKYLYVHANPTNMVDPTGRWGLTGFMAGISIASNIRNLKNEMDFIAFDIAVAVADAIETKKTVEQAMWSFAMDQALGFASGWLVGKGLGILSAVWENGIGHGANRHALKEFFGTQGGQFARRARPEVASPRAAELYNNGMARVSHSAQKPPLPPPRAADPIPGDLANNPTTVRAAEAEWELAKWTHAAPEMAVVSHGGVVNQGGPDVVAVNIETGEVVIADAKYSEQISQNGYAPTIDQINFEEGGRLNRWIEQAQADIKGSDLPQHTKDKAFAELDKGNVGVAVVGFGTKSGQQRLYDIQGGTVVHSEIRHGFDI